MLMPQRQDEDTVQERSPWELRMCMRTTGELQRMSKASDVKTGADLFLGSLRSEVGGGAKTATDSSAEGRVKNEEPTFRVAVDVDNFRIADDPGAVTVGPER
jgi:hypothetical protein